MLVRAFSISVKSYKVETFSSSLPRRQNAGDESLYSNVFCDDQEEEKTSFSSFYPGRYSVPGWS